MWTSPMSSTVKFCEHNADKSDEVWLKEVKMAASICSVNPVSKIKTGNNYVIKSKWITSGYFTYFQTNASIYLSIYLSIIYLHKPDMRFS